MKAYFPIINGVRYGAQPTYKIAFEWLMNHSRQGDALRIEAPR
jgi:hypothetical protein